MAETLYRKYRPTRFSEVIGQEPVVTTLEAALRQGRLGHAYLFTGPRGTGKTTLARILAKAANCLDRKGSEPCGKCLHCTLMQEGRSLDVNEIDAASHTGVDNIRELRETLPLPPAVGPYKVFIIDEVHMLSQGAFNALLKTLEEPPSHALFILATTALSKVPDTILSRCQRFDLGRFPLAKLEQKLSAIAKAENIPIEPGALHEIALAAEGGMRDAESLLTQLQSLSDTKITEGMVREVLGSGRTENFSELLGLLDQGRLAESLERVRTFVQEGRDFSAFTLGFLHYARLLLLLSVPEGARLATDQPLSETAFQEAGTLARRYPPATWVNTLEVLQEAQTKSKTSLLPELPLELALVKIYGFFHPEGGAKPAAEETPAAGAPGEAPAGPQPEKGESQETPKEEKEKPPKKSGEKEGAKEEPKPSSAEKPEGRLLGFDLSRVQGVWHDILTHARELNASLSLALSTARPLEIVDDTIRIAVRYPFHKERLDDPANQLTLAEAFDTILGSKIRLEIVLESEDERAEAKGDNPLVSQALSLLGGRIAS
jgi:DNA polymerase-3 subunit gamma/tau